MGEADTQFEAAPDTAGSAIRKKRRGGTRRKTGCHTCKTRHIRCDEKKPVCTNCERLHLHCQAYELIIKPSPWCSAPAGALSSSSRVQPDGSSTGKVHGDASTADSNGASVVTPESIWDVFNQIRVPNGGTGSGEATTDGSHSPLPASSSVPHTRHSPLDTVPLTAEMAHLLAVYRAGVATWMDIFDHGCAYQREVLRRCLTSKLLLTSICAFTAKHLSLLRVPSGGNPDLNAPDWAAAAARYYGESLRMLIACLSNNRSSQSPHDDPLTAAMLLGSYEMIAAQGQEHRRHFHGAMVLVKTHGINAQSVEGLDRANFWIYVRHDITVALINETKLQVSPKEWNVKWREGESEEDTLGNQMLWLVGRAIDVAYALPCDLPDKGVSDSERQNICADAARWLDSLPLSFRGVKYGELGDDHGFTKIYFAVPAAAAAMMYYHLLHILLYAEPTLHQPSWATQVQDHASEIANIALSDLPQSVRSFSHSPLFFAAKHIKGRPKTMLLGLLEDLEVQHGFSTRGWVKKLQHIMEIVS